MPFSGTQSRKFKFRIHNPVMGLVDAWRHGFWAFSGSKKNDFCFKHFGKSWHQAVADESWLFLKNKQSNETYKKKKQKQEMSKSWNQGSHTFSKTIFHTFSIPNEKTLLPSLIFIFLNFIHGAQCKKYLRNCHRRKMQNSNKRIAKFEISILFHYCMCILAKFSTFSRSWKRFWKSMLFHTFKTACEPCKIIKFSSKHNTRTGD